MKNRRVALGLAASWLAAAAVLVSLPSVSCICDCAGTYNMFRASSGGIPVATLSVGGDGCGDAVCRDTRDRRPGCRQFTVPLKQGGTCHLVATATDGRQAVTDVTVRYTKTTCCGKMYDVGANDVDLSFATPDAGSD